MPAKLTFYGGAREVTGANYLLETDTAKLVIDCGLHQGCHFCEGRNRRTFPYDPASLDAVLVTHAHIDHTGLLPKLVRDGFQKKIFATPPTRDLAAVMLDDSVDLIREEMEERGEEAPYDRHDVAQAMEQFVTEEYHKPFAPAPGVTATFYDAGHILGSSSILVRFGETKLLFSGDLGNSPTPLLRDREIVSSAEYVLVEAVYGDRIHEDRDERRNLLEKIIVETVRQKGVLVIPTFAMERTQEILAELNTLITKKRIPKVPIYLDSPLAIRATEVYQRYPSYYNTEAQKAIEGGDIPFRFPGLQFTPTVEDSKSINAVPPPKIILAGAGMLQGGRVLHHLQRYLRDPNSAVLILGFQAAGSLGRRLLAKPHSVRIFQETVPVRARVKAIGGYSSHADQTALLEWIAGIQPPPKKVFIIQGEAAASLALREEIRARFQIDALVPVYGEQFEFP